MDSFTKTPREDPICSDNEKTVDIAAPVLSIISATMGPGNVFARPLDPLVVAGWT